MSDSKERLIMETLDLTEQQATLALDLAEGDIEKALTMSTYVDPVIMIIMASFILGSKNKEYGLFTFIAHGREGKTLSVLPIINYREELGMVSLDISPEAFIQDLKNMKKDGEDRSGARLLSFFYEELASSGIYSLYTLAKEEREEEIAYTLGDLLKNFLGRQIELFTKTHLLTPLQCDTRRIQLEDTIEEEDDDEQSTSFVMHLETSPLVSPNKGKPIHQFKVGEMIPVVIVDKTEAGRYMGDLLTKKGERSVLAEIKDISHDEETDRYQVSLIFGPKVEGRFLVESQVRLAFSEGVEEEGEEEEEEEKQKKKRVDWLLVGLLLLGLLLLFVIGSIIFF